VTIISEGASHVVIASRTYPGGQGEGGAGAAERNDQREEDTALIRAHAVDESASQGPCDDVAVVG